MVLKKYSLHLIVLFFFFWVDPLVAQTAQDSIKVHSPKKAAIYSAVFPGAGQVYNKKVWKLPIVYGFLGASIYAFTYYQQQYSYYRTQYFYALEGSPNLDPELATASISGIKSAAENSRNLMEYSIVGIGAVYALQIVDALVDGHLYSFDVSDNLSFNINPTSIPILQTKAIAPTLGIQLSITKK